MRRMLLIICKLLLLALGGVTIEEVHANEMQCDTINGISNVYDINKLKEIGDSAYVKGDYTIAIKNYETILTKGEAAEVYYNLGNSYYKSGDIARAILKDAPILILDEATSALDNEVEAEVSQGINNLIQGKTVIAVAHRLSTLKAMDRIVVLDKGKIIEEGTPDSLIKKGGKYAKLWKLQTS